MCRLKDTRKLVSFFIVFTFERLLSDIRQPDSSNPWV